MPAELEDFSDEDDEEFKPDANLEDEDVDEVVDAKEDDAEAGADDDDEDEEDEDERPAKGSAQKKRKKSGGGRTRNPFIDDAAAEDDDEEEEEGARRGKKAKRSRFVDDMAAEDGGDEDDDDDEDDFGDLIANEEAEAAQEEGSHLRSAYQRASRQDDMTDEQLEKFVKERYEERTAYEGDAGSGDEDAGIVGQQGLLPHNQDPKLWVVQCRLGTEREMVISLLQKYNDLAAAGKPLGIKSAFCHDHLSGYIYVESYKETHVREAIQGLRNIFAGKGAKLVPLAEMVDAVSVPKPTKALLERDSWARVKSGMYKDDLARVIDVDYSTGRATIEVVPRIDYAALASKERALPFGRTPTVRPAPRSFNAQEAKDNGGVVERERGRAADGGAVFVLNGKQRFRNGYLQRSIAIRSLIILSSVPPLDELQRYKQAAQNADGESNGVAGDLTSLVKSLADADAPPVQLSKGDRVLVIEGDLKNLNGRVTRVAEDGKVDVMPQLEGLTQVLTFEPGQLEKFFEAGDHVKVTSGESAGETGMVVRVEEAVAVVFLDSTKTEIRVFKRDLSESTEIISLDRFGAYDLHDLVVLDHHTVGVIVEIAKEACKVLTNHGSVERPDIRTCRLPDIKRKMVVKGASASDLALNQVHMGDVVTVVKGAAADRSGTIKYIYRQFLFLHARGINEYGGYFGVISRDCKLRGSKTSAGNLLATPGRALPLRSPAPYQMQMQQRSVLSSPARTAGNGAGSGGFSGSANLAERDEALVGRTIKVMKGPYKSYKGRVVSATGSHVRMELQAQYKTVTVNRRDLSLENQGAAAAGAGGRTPGYSGAPATPMHPGGRTPMHPGAQTPMHAWGSQTPMHPGATPLHPGATPLHAPATPSWDPTRTPHRDSAWQVTPPTPAHVPATARVETPGTHTFGNSSPPQYTPGTAGTPGPYGTPADTPGMYSPADGGAGYTPSANGTPAWATGGTPALYSPAGGGAMGGGGSLGPAISGGVPATPGFDVPGPAMPKPTTIDELYRDLHVSFRDGSGRQGAVRSVAPGSIATVEIGEVAPDGKLRIDPGAQRQEAPLAELELAQALRRDTIRVLRGEWAGYEGEVTAVAEESELIIKLAGVTNRSIQILQRADCGRVVVAQG